MTSASQIKPRFFASAAAFRKWLEANHDKKSDVWVGYYKKDSGKKGITYPESVDQALCFGWIDGIRKSIDDESYTNRFTPRKSTSIWSRINIERVKELRDLGMMHAAGEAAFAARDEKRTNLYSFEREKVELAPRQLRLFKANKRAWQFFQSQPPSYQKPALWWVISAKQEATRERRLGTLIADSANGLRIAQLRPTPKPKKKAK